MQPAKKILDKARRGGYAIGAFNAANIETVKAIVQAAQKLKSPVIIEASPGEADFIGIENLASIVENFRHATGLPILINLDHANDPKNILRAAKAGFDLLHYDGSKLPINQNLKVAKKLIPKLHQMKKVVEIEISHITGSSEFHATDNVKDFQIKSDYTKPDEAAYFLKQTQADILAVFVGNVHGVFTGPEMIYHPQLKKIRRAVKTNFSLHGGSGIPGREVRKAIKSGIVKVNVNTELRLAYRHALETALKNTSEAAIYKIMPDVITAVQKVVEEKIKIFGSAGKA
jgi:fructose-bisphosphate aldolase class II